MVALELLSATLVLWMHKTSADVLRSEKGAVMSQ